MWESEGGGASRVVTPEAGGTLLPGVVRDSLLTLARDLGYEAGEERVGIEEWRKGCDDGQLLEVFACGTAAVVAPVGTVRTASAEWVVGSGRPGPVTTRLREALLDIQHGAVLDRFGWMEALR